MTLNSLPIQFFIWTIFTILIACSNIQLQDENKLESNTMSSDSSSLRDSCRNLWTELLKTDDRSRLLEDTLSYKSYYSSIELSDTVYNFEYNKLTFHTGNKLFDKQLEVLTDSLVYDYYESSKMDFEQLIKYAESKEEIEFTRFRFSRVIDIMPIYINSNSASFSIYKWAFSGGTRGGFYYIYKNYIFKNGNTIELTINDFVNEGLNLDTVFFDPIKNKVFFEYQKKLGCYPVWWNITEWVISFNELLTQYPYESSIDKRFFVFSSDGIRIKYYYDYHGSAQSEDDFNYNFDGKVILRNEFQKAASETILELWRDSLSQLESSDKQD